MSINRINAMFMAFTVAFFASTTVTAQDNDSFSFGVGGTHPVLWKDYKPLQDDGVACNNDGARQSRTCNEVNEKVVFILHQSFLQAAMINVGVPDKYKFCDDYATELVMSKDIGGMAAYAMLLIDDRLKYGSSLYGDNLPRTYVGKLVFDALHAQSPCTK